jgi:serine protease
MKNVITVVLFFFSWGYQTLAQKTSNQYFKMPNKAYYSKGSVLAKIKPEYKSMFEVSSAGGRVESINGAGATPLVPKAQSNKAMAGRLSLPSIDITAYYKLTFDGSRDVERYINELYSTGYFELVEPDYIYQSHVEPNDPQAASQYHLKTIKAYEAWNSAKGSDNPSVVIAIIDSGGDLKHEDLKQNLYVNPNEIPSNGIDDDNNGYIDDVQGWDFIGADTANWVGDNNVQVTKGGLISHGTWTSGCASATTNNGIGVAGVAYNTKLLYTKHSGDNQKTSSGAIYSAYEGLLYAAKLGIKVINCSFGGSSRSQIVQDLINHVVLDLGCLVVASAGNDGNTVPNYPASYDNVLSVAATDSNDKVASFSSYGASVDISAPGKGILTTGYNGVYQSVDGTSFSSPIVAGAAAVVWAKNPTFTPQQVAEQLRVTADATALYTANPNFVNQLGKGRLDINRALTLSFPSVRASNIKLISAKGVGLNAGEKGFLSFTFTNYLQATNYLQVSISTTSSYATISKSAITLGAIATNTALNNSATPFELTLSANAPENTAIDFIITYTDGNTYTDTQVVSYLVNRSFLDINKNDITTTLSGIGRIGFEDSQNTANGDGFIFAKQSMLYEMGIIMGTSAATILNNVRGANNNFDQDFVSITKINERIPGQRSYSEVYGSFSNSLNASEQKVSVNYTSLVWQQKPYNQFAILEYKVKNTTSTPINGFYFGIFADWDINKNGSEDAAGYDTDTRLGYVYPVTSTTLPLGGVQSLTGTPGYYAIDNLDSNAGSGSFGLYNTSTGSFTDVEKFTSISSGLGRLKAGVGNAKGNDVSHVVSSGPYSIAAGQEITIAFALHAANNLSELKTSAVYADSVYNKILSAAKSVAACYDTPATIKVDKITNWYKYPVGGEILKTSNEFTTGNIKNDTILYISGIGNNTARIPITISNSPTINTSGATTLCDGQSVTLSVADADSYQWSNGAKTKTIEVKSTGDYYVVVKNNSLNCQLTSKTISVKVNPNPTAKFTSPTSVGILATVQFTDQSTNAAAWLWDFGDGTTSNLQNPTHKYSNITNVTVKLTVKTGTGCANSVSNPISVVTGLEDQAIEKISVFPNPITSNTLIVEIPQEVKANSIQLINTMGQRVFEQELTATAEKHNIQVPASSFPPGIYIVKVKTSNGLTNIRVVKN